MTQKTEHSPTPLKKQRTVGGNSAMKPKTKNPYALHEQALKTASALKYVVVPLEGNTPIPATFVQADSDELAHGHTPCVFTMPTAYELVRNLKASRGLVCTCITEVQFHELALKSLAGKHHTVE